MRHLKLLGIVMTVAFATSVIAATSAFATYHSEIEKTNIKGAQVGENVFSTKVGTIKCTTATFNATEVKGTKKATSDFTSETLTVQPLYGKATGAGFCNFLGLSASVQTTGCKYTFTKATSTNPPKVGTTHAVVHIECEAGKEIVMKDIGAELCEIKIPPQITGGVVMFSNLNAGKEREVEAEAEVTKIKYSWVGLCPNAKEKPGEGADGTYTGNVRFKGEDPSSKAQVGIWVE